MENVKQKKEPHKTALVICMGMLAVFMATKHNSALYTSLIIGAVSALSDWAAQKIEFFWMKLAWFLGKIVPNILLSFIFYVSLTPLALLSRLFGEKNPLGLKNTQNSTFKDQTKTFNKATFEKPW